VVCPLLKGNGHEHIILTLVSLTFTRLKRALERVDAGPGGSNMAFWTSLREVGTGLTREFSST